MIFATKQTVARAVKLSITTIRVPGPLQQTDRGRCPEVAICPESLMEYLQKTYIGTHTEASNYSNSCTRLFVINDSGTCTEVLITPIRVPGYLQQADSGMSPEDSNCSTLGTNVFAKNAEENALKLSANPSRVTGFLQQTDRGTCPEGAIYPDSLIEYLQ